MTKIFAHRGASAYAPENTMAAFELALEQGAHGIETDVHLTKDGKIVITHDPQLGRTILAQGDINDYTLKELKDFDCGSWFSPEFKAERVPELSELLSLVEKRDIDLNIEIKMGHPYYVGLEQILAKEINLCGFKERIIVSSFNHYSLLEMEKSDPTIKRGFLTGSLLINSWDYVAQNRGQALHPHFHTVTADLVKSCHDLEIKVNTYTVNQEEQGKRVIDTGADGLITNYPDTMLALLK